MEVSIKCAIVMRIHYIRKDFYFVVDDLHEFLAFLSCFAPEVNLPSSYSDLIPDPLDQRSLHAYFPIKKEFHRGVFYWIKECLHRWFLMADT